MVDAIKTDPCDGAACCGRSSLGGEATSLATDCFCGVDRTTIDGAGVRESGKVET